MQGEIIPLLCKRIQAGGLAGLTEAERQVFAMNWLIVEANIGGLHQFFFNDAGKFTADTLAGLNRVGALEIAELFQNAMNLFPAGHVPIDIAERRAALGALSPVIQWEYLSELTAQYFRTNDDLPALIKNYISAHSDLFPALSID